METFIKEVSTKDKLPILLLHGYGANKESFNAILPFLERDFKIYSLDLKGFGENRDMEHPYSLSDYVEEVKGYIKEKMIVRPVVIAHSFGARIAIKMAAEDKTAFSGLVLTGAAGLKPRFSLKKATKRTVFKILKRFIPKEKLTRFYSADYNSLSPMMKESFIKVVNEYLDGAAKKILCPTLLVFGTKDKETPVYMGKRLKRYITDSELYLLRGAGHFAFLNAPREFSFKVRRFIEERCFR